jgi:hypothetical protein
MVRRSPRLAAVYEQNEPSTTKKRVYKQAETPSSDAQSIANSIEVELDIGSILGTITERLSEQSSHRLFDYYTDLIGSTYDRNLQVDYICNMFESIIQTMVLTQDAKKRSALFAALGTLNDFVFGMMDVPLAKKIRLNVAIRHLQKL